MFLGQKVKIHRSVWKVGHCKSNVPLVAILDTLIDALIQKCWERCKKYKGIGNVAIKQFISKSLVLFGKSKAPESI